MQPVCTSVNPPLTAAGDLLVTTGTVCVIGVEFINDLTVTSGATLYMSGTNVFGRFKTVQASSVILCGNLIIGRASIAQTAGTVLVGQGPDGAIGQGLGCYGNEFDGDLLTVISNNLTRTGYVQVSGNRLTSGSLTLTSNLNGTAVGNQDIEVEGNQIAGQLKCLSNSPAPTNDGYPNQATSRGGQCAAAGF